MNKRTAKSKIAPNKKQDDEQPKPTEEQRMFANEDMLTETGRDPNKSF